MSLVSKNFPTTAKTLAVALLSTAFMASNAQAAEPLTCYTKQEDIAAAQQRIIKGEGMMAATSHFTNVGTNQKAEWAMTTLMYNPQTKKGYQWARMPAGHVCVAKSYSNIEMFSNSKFDVHAFLDIKQNPNADDRGNGKNFSSMGANAVLLTTQAERQLPMYRANVDDIINVTGEDLKTPRKYVEFLVGNASTKEGTVLAANFNGKMIAEYTAVVGIPIKDGVKFGAIYSPAMEQMLGMTSSVAALALSQK